MAKEKSRARHTWLYQAEEEFEKVSLGARAQASSVRVEGVLEPGGQCLGDSLTLTFPL